MEAGEHKWSLDFEAMQLPVASYIYQVEVFADRVNHRCQAHDGDAVNVVETNTR